MGMETQKSMKHGMREYGERDKEIFGKKEEKLEHEEMTIGEILRARADGSHSTNTSNVIPMKFPRANKNRPMEMSSKVWVGRYREVIQVPQKPRGDPRFDPLCRGTFDPEKFRKDYSFLFDEELPKEKERLKKLIKKSKDPNVIEELKNEISLIDKQIKPCPRKSGESEILSEHIKKEREAAKKGKRPYYLKKSEIRERKLIKKYSELKAAGNLDSYIEKRQKRNASKDHRYMPYRRE